MTGIPGRSARRSRRGYCVDPLNLPDLWALHCCIEMLEGLWTSLTSDGHEDVTCENSGESRICYVQVKTEEHPDGVWTVAKLCQADGGGVESSILGKLFVDKPLPDGARFELVGNVALNRELAPLEPQAVVDRRPVEAEFARRFAGFDPCGPSVGLLVPRAADGAPGRRQLSPWKIAYCGFSAAISHSGSSDCCLTRPRSRWRYSSR